VTQADIPRKVGQLGEDVYELYGLLNTISKTQAAHGATLADLDTGMKDVRIVQLQQRTRLNQVEGRLASVDARLAQHSAVLAEHGTVLASHGVLLADQGARLDRIEDNQHKQSETLAEILRLLSEKS
jgi:septal ring factor EnvC (AmiA/AmiB activator)